MLQKHTSWFKYKCTHNEETYFNKPKLPNVPCNVGISGKQDTQANKKYIDKLKACKVVRLQ